MTHFIIHLTLVLVGVMLLSLSAIAICESSASATDFKKTTDFEDLALAIAIFCISLLLAAPGILLIAAAMIPGVL